MTDELLTTEKLLDLLRANNGMIIETSRGPLSEYTAMLPSERKISPVMFNQIRRQLRGVSKTTKKGVTTRMYKLRVARITEQ